MGSLVISSRGEALLGSTAWYARRPSQSIAFFKAASMVLLLVCSSPTTIMARSALHNMSKSSRLSPKAQTPMPWTSCKRATKAPFTADETTKPSTMRPPPTTFTFSDRPSLSSTLSQTRRSPQVTTTAPTCFCSTTSCNRDTNSGCMVTADATSWQRASKSWLLAVASYRNTAWRKVVYGLAKSSIRVT